MSVSYSILQALFTNTDTKRRHLLEIHSTEVDEVKLKSLLRNMEHLKYKSIPISENVEMWYNFTEVFSPVIGVEITEDINKVTFYACANSNDFPRGGSVDNIAEKLMSLLYNLGLSESVRESSDTVVIGEYVKINSILELMLYYAQTNCRSLIPSDQTYPCFVHMRDECRSNGDVETRSTILGKELIEMLYTSLASVNS